MVLKRSLLSRGPERARRQELSNPLNQPQCLLECATELLLDESVNLHSPPKNRNTQDQWVELTHTHDSQTPAKAAKGWKLP